MARPKLFWSGQTFESVTDTGRTIADRVLATLRNRGLDTIADARGQVYDLHVSVRLVLRRQEGVRE